MATALRLARMGLAVTVFEPAAPGDNASGVAAGMLAPVSEALFDPLSSAHLALMRRARDLGADIAIVGSALVSAPSLREEALRFKAECDG